MKLVGQMNEYRVETELGRRGLVATAFTDIVPDYDIIVPNENGKTISDQAKTNRGSSWHFGNIAKLVVIKFESQKQIVKENRPSPVKNLVFVFVKLGDYGTDRFFICTWSEMCELMSHHHSAYLAKHGGMKPENWESLPKSFSVKEISHFEGRWRLIESVLDQQV